MSTSLKEELIDWAPVIFWFLFVGLILIGIGLAALASQRNANDALIRCVEAGGHPSECAQAVDA